MDNHEVNACCQTFRQNFNGWTDTCTCQKGEHHPDCAGGEVIHQHFKTGLDLTVYPVIEMFNCPAAQRTGDHRTKEHWHISTDDHTHRGDCPYYAAALTTDQTPTGITDQQR